MVRFRRELSKKHKFIFSFILNLQIMLVFGVIIFTLVLLEAKVVGNAGNDIFKLLKYTYLVVFSLESVLTVAYQVCSYFWKQEVFGMYIGEYYKLSEEESSKNE